LEEKISIKHNVDPEKIFFFDMDTTFAFSMCNPPFYASQEEVEQGFLNKELEPSAVSEV
jgi:23S rRNA A1618 N6-methylase RlmF